MNYDNYTLSNCIMTLQNENGDSINILDTVTLPNGGVIYIDARAYNASNGRSNSYNRHERKWTSSLYFEGDYDSIKTAFENTEI